MAPETNWGWPGCVERDFDSLVAYISYNKEVDWNVLRGEADFWSHLEQRVATRRC